MTFWSGEKIKEQMSLLFTDYHEDRIDCAAYTLRMGRSYYLSTATETAEEHKLRHLHPGESLAIPSGQFAVLVTDETVSVPRDAIAFISMKNGLKARGLVNVSGFHVDPGYSAPLRFAVYNAGPATICIKQGDDCFLIWYADLDRADEKYSKTAIQNKSYAGGISSADLNALSGAVTTIQTLSKRIDTLSRGQTRLTIALSIIGFAATVFAGFLIFFAQEGIRNFFTP